MTDHHYAPTEKRLRQLDPMCGYVAPGDEISMDSRQCTCTECLDWIRPPAEDGASKTVKITVPIPLNGAALSVLAERQRQVEAEGWTPEHDDAHVEGIMAQAAACYALRATPRKDEAHDMWPWDDEWWKPKDARQDLVRAGALILAEIERLDRATFAQPQGVNSDG